MSNTINNSYGFGGSGPYFHKKLDTTGTAANNKSQQKGSEIVKEETSNQVSTDETVIQNTNNNYDYSSVVAFINQALININTQEVQTTKEVEKIFTPEEIEAMISMYNTPEEVDRISKSMEVFTALVNTTANVVDGENFNLSGGANDTLTNGTIDTLTNNL